MFPTSGDTESSFMKSHFVYGSKVDSSRRHARLPIERAHPRVEQLPRGRVGNLDRQVVGGDAPGCQTSAVRVEDEVRYATIMTCQGSEFVSRGGVPELYAAEEATRGQVPTVGTKRDAERLLAVS